MRDLLLSQRRLPACFLTTAGLALALLATGLAPAGPGGDETTPPSRIPLREGAPPAPPQALPMLRPADLARAADNAPPAVAALYRELAEPDPEAMPPYEEQALKRIQDFLQKGAEKLPPRARLRAAETALEVVLRFHLSARDRPLTGTNPWATLEARLRRELFDVRRQELRVLAASAHGEKEWAEALALADRLLTIYPRAKALPVEAARVRTGYAGFKLLAGDYRAARRQMEWIETHLPSEPRFEPLRVGLFYRPDGESIRQALRGRAATLLKQARALDDDGAAVAQLRAARDAWPRLPGLLDYLLQRQGAYRVLYVGVPSLPEFLSPATARTDPEKQAVELIFEGLVRERYDDAQGERYLPQLAAGLPERSPEDKLRFGLDRNAFWSDGQRVTSTNVRDTVEQLRSPSLPGRTPEWADLVEPPASGDDLFRIDFRLRQPAFDPLAPLTFKVLPSRAGDPEFGQKPVGSGPYQYGGRRTHDGRLCAVFTANPYYVRGGRADRPYIREIRFYVASDPARDLRAPIRPLHLLLDLPTGRLKALRDAGIKDIRTLRNRRVYFLAANHRTAALDDPNLRRALAHALDRERILTYRFRGGEPGYHLLAAAGGAAAVTTLDLRRSGHAEYHRALNGPYPAGTWAVCPPPQVPAVLHDPDRARAFARKAAARLKEKRPALELTLKYPAGDAQAERACQDIAAQLGELGESVGWPIRIRPEALPPRQLSEAVLSHKYQLAYHHLDYGSEAYWLWPLFDGRPEALQPGGANFLGCEDATLEGLFRAAMGRREFAEVQKRTHEIHARLYETMPLIPLWQLDTHVAVHSTLRPTHLDPLRVFDDVANWKLEK